VDVRIIAFQFIPQHVVIGVGDTVRWRNDDPAEHTVTHTGASPPLFDSGAMQPGEAYAFRFPSPGRFDYWCAVHIDMTGSVTVAPQGPPPRWAYPHVGVPTTLVPEPAGWPMLAMLAACSGALSHRNGRGRKTARGLNGPASATDSRMTAG
jgi:hypothetical protein